MKLIYFLPLIFCCNAFAELHGLSLGVAAGDTDNNDLESVTKLDLTYEYWWDGGFELSYKRFKAPKLTNFDTAGLDIFYQNAVTDFLVFSLHGGVTTVLDDSQAFKNGDIAPHLSLGVQWRINNYLGIDFVAESIYGLGSLDTFNSFYLGVSVWPFADDQPAQVFKKIAPSNKTARLDWQDIAALPDAEPISSPIPEKKEKVKPVHSEPVPDSESALALRAPESGYFYVQIGTFGSEQNAQRAAVSAQYSGYKIYQEEVPGKALHRIMAGSFDDLEAAKQAQLLIWRMFDEKPLIVKR